MKLLLLGAGKTGSLVAEVARDRGHIVETLRAIDNPNASALTGTTLSPFDVVRQAAPAVQREYYPHIYERHHAQKKDAPSGTAATMQSILQESSTIEIEITSFREGEVVGMHELVLDSPNDTIYLCHDAKSRRGFAEGAVRGAEWLPTKKGFFDFRDVWREM